MPAPKNATIPAALRPKPAAPELPELHLALVVPDIRIQKLLTDHCYLIGPTTARHRVTLHAVVNDKNHQGSQLDTYMRWALVETGLFTPDQVGFINPAEVQLGWDTHEKDT